MIELTVFVVIFLVLLCLLLWAVHHRFTANPTGEVSARLPVDFLIPRKSDEFKQAQETLDKLQSDLAQRNLSDSDKRNLLHERNKITRELLTSIHEDFVRLDRLMCAIAAASPEVSRQKEFDRLWLALRFGARYRMALLSVLLGALPGQSISSLQILTKSKAERLRMLLKSVDSALPVSFGKTMVN
jgi:hypothetical protein